MVTRQVQQYARAWVTWRKTTHLRTQGIGTASREGLTEDKIGTLSKHITQKTSRYLTELYPPTLSTQSGFTEILGTYFAPRSGLEIPREAEMTPDQLALLLYPQLTRWRAEYQDPRGDHSQAAHDFLFVLLPFLAMTIFQDGIYWLRYLPEHQANRLLKQVMPNGTIRGGPNGQERVSINSRTSEKAQRSQPSIRQLKLDSTPLVG